jgi:predicted CXXCH cytochrome family protein
MTRTLRYLAVAAITLMAGSAYGSGIVGSAHDFTDESWGGTEICKPCHTPHNAIEATTSSRLWNHQLSIATYTLHGPRASGVGTTLDATRQGGQADMDMGSRLCLSCHDGTVALDSFGRTPAGDLNTGTVMMGTEHATRNLGTDLSNDHPVGVEALYKEQYQPGGHFPYKPSTEVASKGLRLVKLAAPKTYSTSAPGGGTASTDLAVGCMTCHNPHGEASDAGPTVPKLLRMENTSSQLCLACHDK